MPNKIQLSQPAIEEVKRLQAHQKHSEAKFRLAVQAGGCSGLIYALQFDEAMQADDTVYHCDGLDVVVDPKSLSYVEGLTLDYSADLMGGGFRFHNPNAASHCGCGNSFSIDEKGTGTDCTAIG